jgi:hypothetical protein
MKINFFKNLKNQLVTYNRTHYNIRPADTIIILGYVGGCCTFIILFKNFFFDILKSSPADYNIKVWTRVKGYYRLEREPLVYKPEEAEFRDLEKYNKYMDEKTPEKIYDNSKGSEEFMYMYLPKHTREIVKEFNIVKSKYIVSRFTT